MIEAPSKGRVRVAAGPLKLWVELADVRVVGAPQAGSRAEVRPAQEEAPRRPPMPTVDNTLDVRGLRVDDALAMVETFLDRLYGASEPYGFILHGVGSGALRDAIRELLGRSASYVRSQRLASAEEGGPRMTIVELR